SPGGPPAPARLRNSASGSSGGGCAAAHEAEYGRRIHRGPPRHRAVPLAQMGKAVHTSAYHFARQFKAATGIPPHQYVVARRVERAMQLLRGNDELSLADIATHAGFSDQSQLSAHFKRVVGVTPREFRRSERPS